MENNTIDKENAANDLKKLFGLKPYDMPGNHCQGDGYYSVSLEHKYGMTIKELRRVTGIHPRTY